MKRRGRETSFRWDIPYFDCCLPFLGRERFVTNGHLPDEASGGGAGVQHLEQLWAGHGRGPGLRLADDLLVRPWDGMERQGGIWQRLFFDPHRTDSLAAEPVQPGAARRLFGVEVQQVDCAAKFL